LRVSPREPNPGEVLPLKGDGVHYPLPAGLAHGDLVKLISYDCGYWTVEKDGRCYRVFRTRVETELLYEVGALWLPATDPRVQRRLSS
jgi:hypothetical protein